MSKFQGDRVQSSRQVPRPVRVLIPPVIVAILAVMVSILLYRPEKLSSLSDVLIVYSYAALPHLLGILLLLRHERSPQALAAGFLFAFWAILGVYLLIIAIFIFSAEHPRSEYETAWLAAVGFAIWIMISGWFYRRLDRQSFLVGGIAGVAFSIGVPVYLAMLQRGRH